MKNILLALSTLSTLSTSAMCEVKGAKKWIKPNTSLEELAKKHKGKDLLVFARADWGLTSVVLEKHLQSKEITALFNDEGLVLVTLDLTRRGGISNKEFADRGKHLNAVPNFFLIHKDGMVTYANKQVANKGELKKLLTSLLSKREKKVESKVQ